MIAWGRPRLRLEAHARFSNAMSRFFGGDHGGFRVFVPSGRAGGLAVSLLLHGLALGAFVALHHAPAATATRPVPVRIQLAAASPGPPEEASRSGASVPETREEARKDAAPLRPAARAKAPHARPRKAACPAPAPAWPVPRHDMPDRELASAQPAESGSDPGGGGPLAGRGPAAPEGGPSGRGAGVSGRGAGAGDYFGTILSRLERVKRYPDEARRRGQEGAVLVRFVLERSGALVSWRIEKGSGQKALDSEVGAMVRKAAPFPPFPASLDRERLVLVVPVTFRLKQG